MYLLSLIAQQLEVGGQKISGPLVLPGSESCRVCVNNPSNPICATPKCNPQIADIISTLLTFAMPLAGLLLFVALVWGGYDYLFAAGNAKRMQAGQQKITWAIVGFVLLVMSYILVRIITFILGIDQSQVPLQ